MSEDEVEVEVIQAEPVPEQDEHHKAIYGDNPRYRGLVPWQPGQTGNREGRPPTLPKVRVTHSVLNALFDAAARDGKVDLVFNEYFDLMLHAKDDRLRFDVIRDFLDRVGLKPATDNGKVAAQFVNIMRSNSPDLNL